LPSDHQQSTVRRQPPEVGRIFEASVAEARSEILGKSIDGNVVYGALTGPDGPGTEMFGLVGTTARSANEWVEIFQTAGVKIRA
jgi:hypothetical protein